MLNVCKFEGAKRLQFEGAKRLQFEGARPFCKFEGAEQFANLKLLSVCKFEIARRLQMTGRNMYDGSARTGEAESVLSHCQC